MIAANKNGVLDSFLFVYFRWLTRRAFHTIAIRGLEHLENLPADRPFFSSATTPTGGRPAGLSFDPPDAPKGGVLHDGGKAAQALPLLHLAGRVFSRSQQSAALGRLLTLCPAAIGKEETAIWIFPQGRICRPNDPIEVKAGTEYLAKGAPRSLLVPVALRYGFSARIAPTS